MPFDYVTFLCSHPGGSAIRVKFLLRSSALGLCGYGTQSTQNVEIFFLTTIEPLRLLPPRCDSV